MALQKATDRRDVAHRGHVAAAHRVGAGGVEFDRRVATRDGISGGLSAAISGEVQKA